MDRGSVISELKVRDQDWSELLWEALKLYQGHIFTTAGRRWGNTVAPGVEFSYTIKISSRTGKPTEELLISRKEQSKTITRSTVDMAYGNAREVQRQEGFVKGPKRLKVFGASYLYAIFKEWGIITGSP
ncbi:MAG: hypothetical protein K5985_02355 [Lachnospiraceae bacterium]|nr:hypothetical protein [Lachnospiraceae bacterium]